jgi:hypothetical protein
MADSHGACEDTLQAIRFCAWCVDWYPLVQDYASAISPIRASPSPASLPPTGAALRNIVQRHPTAEARSEARILTVGHVFPSQDDGGIDLALFPQKHRGGCP